MAIQSKPKKNLTCTYCDKKGHLREK
ncbi:hypothetical protein A3Q56_08634 [Intoshia linei]|uniref:CCHC-type domain-containing protein n=1 Tax=Intoshia linei TaxID=1819745 RepID=A0A177APA9_9BILA|nr:hypothetical protein A3Q56_08634 [Intoshia linei]